MKNQINIAELLKDCPQGMELDCTLLDNVEFEKLDFNSPTYPIVIRNLKSKALIHLSKYGQLVNEENYKCVIFPKGKTTWEGFQKPFKDGDIIATDLGSVFILKSCLEDKIHYHSYIGLTCCDEIQEKQMPFAYKHVCHLANEEEKQKLFDAIKENGYKWNAETKTLEKLIEPKFKVGDRVRNKYYKDYIYDIHDITDKGYRAREIDADSPIIILFGSPEDNYELVPNKFDITTLVPFESRVLVREGRADVWQPSYYGFLNQRNKRFYTTTNTWSMCIPYNEDTKHLIGTTNDCEEFYKTWK